MGWDALSALTLTPDQKEQRRLAAGQDLLDGKRQTDVADEYGVTRTTAHRWAKTVEDEGLEGLKSTRTNAGRRPELDDKDKQRLAELLQQGAHAHGWETDLWTRKRVAELIQRELGVNHSPRHCSRILHEIGFRPVKPKRVAQEKDEAEKQRWLREEAEELKKT